MHGSGPKIHLKSPLAPQPVPKKLDSMPPSKGPFSANIHPIIPTLSVPIPEGMCFRKMVRGGGGGPSDTDVTNTFLKIKARIFSSKS